jgi:hypothetical protein
MVVLYTYNWNSFAGNSSDFPTAFNRPDVFQLSELGIVFPPRKKGNAGSDGTS